MYERMLVGTDGSATAALAVDRAVDVAQTMGSVLTVFSVGSPTRAAAVVAAEAARHAGAGIDIRTETATGDPASALVERSERGDVDLLVLGSKGMHGPSRFLLGSVPNKVSHHAAVAVLIVRTV
jgi:nucleotide-binding universal stress UspA family protein